MDKSSSSSKKKKKNKETKGSVEEVGQRLRMKEWILTWKKTDSTPVLLRRSRRKLRRRLKPRPQKLLLLLRRRLPPRCQSWQPDRRRLPPLPLLLPLLQSYPPQRREPPPQMHEPCRRIRRLSQPHSLLPRNAQDHLSHRHLEYGSHRSRL